MARTKNHRLVLLLIYTSLVSAGLGFSFPLLDLSLNQMGASGTMIGVNAAMPALGWLLVTPLLPLLQRKFGSRILLIGLLLIAGIAMLGFQLLQNLWAWLPLRFLFGGSIGIAFRVIEFLINAISEDLHRGRNIGIYSVVFCASFFIGVTIVPVIGTTGWGPYLFVCTLLTCGATVFFISKTTMPEFHAPPQYSLTAFINLLPVAMLGVFVWGVLESIPTSMMPIYALRVGFSGDWPTLTVSAFALGSLLFPIPLGLLSDRMDRQKLLLMCASIGIITTILIPKTLFAPEFFLLALLVWGGVCSGLYIVSLAIIGEKFRGTNLTSANAAFGTLYAVGGLIGPLINGTAMDVWNPDGLLYSAATILGIFILLGSWLMVSKVTPTYDVEYQ
jgi:MFS family permease